MKKGQEKRGDVEKVAENMVEIGWTEPKFA